MAAQPSGSRVYTLLIDSFRLHMKDEMNFRGDVDEDYYQGDAAKSLKRFLVKAEKRGSIMPPWWNEQKREACIAHGKKIGWSDLRSKIEKSDFTEHYGNPMMPMRVRMLAEEITGSEVMSMG